MSSSANRTKLVNACVSAVNTYSLDGIDIDWARLLTPKPNTQTLT